MTSYQAQWKDGKEVMQGKRDCAGRYDAIRAYLSENYPDELNSGNLRVLDFGAQGGYFAQRLNEEFGVNVTAVESNRKALRHLTGRPGIKTITAQMSAEQVRRLGPFDVVLALSVLHHQPNWREYLDAFTSIGSVIFIETSHPEENLPKASAQGDAEEILWAVGEIAHKKIAETPGYDDSQMRSLWVVEPHREHVHASIAELGGEAPEVGAVTDLPADAEDAPPEEFENPVEQKPRRGRKPKADQSDSPNE